MIKKPNIFLSVDVSFIAVTTTLLTHVTHMRNMSIKRYAYAYANKGNITKTRLFKYIEHFTSKN